MQIVPVSFLASPKPNAPAGSPLVPAPTAAGAVGSPPPGLDHVGTVRFVSEDGRYGYLDSADFRSVFVWQHALETPDELRIGQRIAFAAGGVGWDPNHVEAVRARILPA